MRDRPSARDYLNGVEHLFRSQLGGLWGSNSTTRIDEGDVEGALMVDLHLSPQRRLLIRLAVDVTSGTPSWPLYTFHLQDGEGTCLLRYDNFPHHADVAPDTFPHHKHRGDDVLPSHQPTIHQVIVEVRELMDLGVQ